MDELRHRVVETNGICMHLAEQGSGPLVILCHGFPESWYSWRHQLPALAAADYHAVAPDMRGYGGTDHPAEIERYTILHLVGDMIGLMDALGAETAVVAGHDWGAPVAWHTALLRPDRVRGVIGLSVPHLPRGPLSPLAGLRLALGEDFYMVYFQQPGRAEAELERDPATLPAWLTEADVDVYAAEFERTGFAGGLNWYRNLDRNWELTAPWQDAKVTPPALFMAGDRDLVVGFPGFSELIANLQTFVPNLRQNVLLPGCGHWTQQERPDEVTAALLEFLQGL